MAQCAKAFDQQFVYGFVHLKEDLGLFKMSTGLTPVLGFYL